MQRNGSSPPAVCGTSVSVSFIFVRPALLPQDIRYIAADLNALQAVAPQIGDWLGNVFTVMGGFMAGAGVLVAYFGWMILPSWPRWGRWCWCSFGPATHCGRHQYKASQPSDTTATRSSQRSA